jgi:cell division septum initiation protein DivIVA
MRSFEGTPEETVSETTVEDGTAGVDDVAAEPPTSHESPTGPARMLELAALTADRLVADAKAEAESLVTDAHAEADAVRLAGRTEASQVAAELARSKEEQTAELERERATALAGLAAEKATLEDQIATLRRVQSEHRRQLREHLEAQLSTLDAAMPEPPPSLAD